VERFENMMVYPARSASKGGGAALAGAAGWINRRTSETLH
jgi:hypothetical protein